LPLFVWAQGILSGPIVPCGTELNPSPCTFCDIFVIIQKLIEFITAGIIVLAVIFVAVGGINILTSAGSPDKVDLGKRMIKYTVIGIVIALLSWVIINEILIAVSGSVAGERVGKIFDWPWNQIQCVGGGTTPIEQIYTFCHLQYRGRTDPMIASFDTEDDCRQECRRSCDTVVPRADCEAWCCLDSDRSGEDNVCTPTAGEWCKSTPAPSGSNLWKIGGPMRTTQFTDASPALVNLINCMYGRNSTFVITAISSSYICDNLTCNPLVSGCGHIAIPSCHFGGANCTGKSYAVDFSATTPLQCDVIRSAAKYCNSNAWVNWETDHVHVSLNRQASCGCAEVGVDGAPCPSP